MEKKGNAEISEPSENLKKEDNSYMGELTMKNKDADKNNIINMAFNKIGNDPNAVFVNTDKLLENVIEINESEQDQHPPFNVDPMTSVFPKETLIKNTNPSVIKRKFEITHKEGIIRYTYTLVFYKNYNIFFITPNGKFASWVYSCTHSFVDSYEQETEIIFGERDHPYLEMFCSKFMNEFGTILNHASVLFAVSVYDQCYDNKDVLKQIFDNLSDVIMYIHSFKKSENNS